MAAARAFGVEGRNRAALEGCDRVLDEARFVQRVGVDRDLHVVPVRDRQAVVDRRRRRAPILVELQAVGAGHDLLFERARQRGIALALEAEVHRKGLGRLQHRMDVPRPRRAGRREGAGGRPGTAAQHRRHAAHQRFLDLLRADEVDVRVDATRGEDRTFARDDLGARADHDVHARLHVRIAGLADARDEPVLERDIGLHDAPVIDDERVRDDGIGDFGGQALALAHAVADRLAAAELHLLAIAAGLQREVLLDLDDEARIGQPHAVTGGRAEHLGIGAALEGGHDACSASGLSVYVSSVTTTHQGSRCPASWRRNEGR